MTGVALTTQTLPPTTASGGSPLKRSVPSKRPFPHLDDLVASSKPTRTKDNRFSELVADVQTNLSQANWNLDLGRLDVAYVDFLRASQVLLELIPRHSDWPSIRALGEPARYGTVVDLQRRIDAQTSRFEQVRDQIKQDNIRHSTQSRARDGTEEKTYNAARVSIEGPTSRDPTGSTVRPLSPSPSSERAMQNGGSKESPASALQSPRRRPAVRSKPQHLISRPVPIATTSQDLTERFSRLRARSPPEGAERLADGLAAGPQTRRSSTVEEPISGGVGQHVHENEDGLDEASFNTRFPPVDDDSMPRHRPMGPRDPPTASQKPAIPPKIPISEQTTRLPRAPSPSYDPVVRTNSGYFAASSNRSSKLSMLPVGPEIEASTLYQCSKPGPDRLAVLLIDVRSRAEFDAGHILHKTVICVEPLAISSQMSAEDLENRLVVSPEGEQELFGKRHKFDVIILYDSDGRAKGVVDDLARILWDFSYEKPLVRQPYFLVGGLKAWVDLLGRQAVSPPNQSNHPMNPAALQRARPATRLPSSSMIQRRKTLEREPLKARESQRWLERLREDEDVKFRSEGETNGSVDGPSEPPNRQSTEAGESVYNRSYEEYLRRAGRTGPPSFDMAGKGEQTQIPPAYPDVPTARYSANQTTVPSRPVPIQRPDLAFVPSRPAPAAPKPSYGGVSEKIPPMPSGQVGQVLQKKPLPPSLSHSISPLEDGSIGKTGLQNLGNTCYMNSVLQCLSATSPLSHYFLNGSHMRDVVKDNKLGSRGILPLAYANLLSFLWKGNYKFIVPTTLREFCGRLNEDFRNNRQQDANDFFVFFVDLLHEDLNQNYDKVRLKELTVAEERTRETLPIQKASRIEWDRWTHSNFSVVARQFGGQHASRLRCLSCGFTSTSFETFYSIPLEIPLKGKSSIHQCLENYTKEERLDKDNNWKCPQCERVQQTSKKITITRAPPVLVIQFKRFKASKHGWMDKIKTKVDFPVDSLDITPFSAPALPASAQMPGRHTEPEATPPYRYDVYGIVNHFGTLDGGHYKAVIRSGSKSSWVEFDDSRVSKFDPGKVVSDAAYMLFCVRNMKT